MFVKSKGAVSVAVELLDTEEENSDEPADAEVTLASRVCLPACCSLGSVDVISLLLLCPPSGGQTTWADT